MRKFNRHTKNICGVLSFFFLFSITTEALACWGSRPLAMGGAFTGLADDTNAIYWNPGGLGLNSSDGATNMSNLGGENNSNYDQYFASATRIIDKEDHNKNYGTLAFAFVTNDTVIDEESYKAEYSRRNRKRQSLTINEDTPFVDHDTYTQIGYGVKPFDSHELAIGVSFKSVKSEVDDPVDDRDTEWMDLDLGMIWKFGPQMGKSKLFSIGFLLQNVSEAKLIEDEDSQSPEMIRNFRPGFSIKPDAETILSVEIYDAMGETEGQTNDVSQNIRLGAERWLAGFLALRAGVYHLNNKDMLAYTGGVGIRLPKFWNTRAEFDLTIMHWDKTNTNTGFGGVSLFF